MMLAVVGHVPGDQLHFGVSNVVRSLLAHARPARCCARVKSTEKRRIRWISQAGSLSDFGSTIEYGFVTSRLSVGLSWR